MTTYTATEYIRRLRAGEIAVPLGYSERDDEDASLYPAGDDAESAVEALHEALYCAAEGWIQRYAESPLDARVYICGQMPDLPEDAVGDVARALLGGGYYRGDLQDALDERIGQEEIVAHVEERLKGMAAADAHPLASAMKAYRSAVAEALRLSMTGCWATTGDEVVMDEATLELLRQEEEASR